MSARILLVVCLLLVGVVGVWALNLPPTCINDASCYPLHMRYCRNGFCAICRTSADCGRFGPRQPLCLPGIGFYNGWGCGCSVNADCPATHGCCYRDMCEVCTNCVTNADCSIIQHCVNGKCKAGECDTDADCPKTNIDPYHTSLTHCAGHKCHQCTDNTHCVQYPDRPVCLLVGTPAAGGQLQRNECGCINDNDCPVNQRCKRRACEPIPAQCNNNGDCGSGEYCDAGECQTGECVIDYDCPRSDPDLVFCGANSTCVYCKDDSRCPWFAPKCSDGNCVCTQNSDCPSESPCCEDSVCMSCSPECYSNVDCPSDEHCEYDMCVDEQCLDDADCPRDDPNENYCVDGSCEYCRDNNDCPSDRPHCIDNERCACEGDTDCSSMGYCCIEEYCQTCPPECLSNSDCETNEHCESGQCVSPQCGSDTDCPRDDWQEYYCVDGSCEYCREDANCPSDRPRCVDHARCACEGDTDCSSLGYCCIDEYCQTCPPECYSKDDCASNEHCENGECVSGECYDDFDCPRSNPNNYYCEENSCVYCKDDFHCPFDRPQCVDHERCACTSNSDCPWSGYCCVSEACNSC